MRTKTNFKLQLLFTCLVTTTLLGMSCSDTSRPGSQEANLTQYVDQYIGTGGHGHVFMGANVPFGLVQLGPTSIPQSWDWTSGYHISDTTVIGFSHMHLNGTGIGDLSDISLMPVVGSVKLSRGVQSDPQSGLWSYFSRSNERVRPGYYATRLDRYGIDVELTATKRVGFHKYKFPQSDNARVVIDLENGTCWDEPIEGYITQIDDQTISGYRYSKGWANDQKVFFTAKFSKPMRGFKVSEGDSSSVGSELKGKKVYGEAIFDTKADEVIYVKVAISPVSIDNAQLNMDSELPEWDFDQTAILADKMWNDQLSKIEIKTNDISIKRNFYTALYHTMVAPSEFCDVNRDYRGSDSKIYTNNQFVNYTTFSLWDTYRAAHPLMTIIHPEKVNDIINTMLHIYQQQGKLPVWHLMGCETDCMIGNPGISVVADAILKGYDGFDHQLAYEAMRTSAMLDERGMGLRKELGYIPYDKYNESVATCMEYAIADWSLAQVAKQMGNEEDYVYFTNRSKSYKNYFDPKSGFMRGLSSQGKFRETFNPFASTHREDDYTEGTAWQYTFLVPHDMQGLIELFGSKDAFVQKLDSLFVVSGELGDNASPDIGGLIGQYAHGNEPSHHVVYFYTMLGQPWKTADKVREILTTLYHDRPDGLSGNEDVGQMSAWYILSSMGFYQAEPAAGRYYFGSPLVDQAVIAVGGGRKLTITANNNSPENKYIQSVKLNAVPYTKGYIDFKDIALGGTLDFEMGTEQSVWY